MPNMTFPNQRMIRIHRERATADFLGIKNENWQAAARDLGAHATLLYLYLASNANGYTDALSPAAVRQAIGMARSTYHDQFHKLVDKGYLVQGTGNTFDFYEVPQSGKRQTPVEHPSGGKQENPAADAQKVRDASNVVSQDTEINNRIAEIDSGINNSNPAIHIPEVKEVVIQRPVRQPKEEIPRMTREDFIF